MTEILGLGFLTALAIFILMAKINIQWFAKYHWQVDIVISLGLTILFLGTFSGVMTAVIAGIFISLFLGITRKIIVY